MLNATYSPSSLDLGAVSPGQASSPGRGVGVTAPAAAQVTASIVDDSSNGAFSIAGMIVSRWVTIPGAPLRPGQVPHVPSPGEPPTRQRTTEVVAQTDGPGTVSVEAGDMILVNVRFVAPTAPAAGSTYRAVLLIQGSGWNDIQVPLSATVGQITIRFVQPAVGRQGGTARVLVDIQSVAGPATTVSFQVLRPSQGAPWASLMSTSSFQVSQGGQQLDFLDLSLQPGAPTGTQTLNFAISAFNGELVWTQSCTLVVRYGIVSVTIGGADVATPWPPSTQPAAVTLGDSFDIQATATTAGAATTVTLMPPRLVGSGTALSGQATPWTVTVPEASSGSATFRCDTTTSVPSVALGVSHWQIPWSAYGGQVLGTLDLALRLQSPGPTVVVGSTSTFTGTVSGIDNGGTPSAPTPITFTATVTGAGTFTVAPFSVRIGTYTASLSAGTGTVDGAGNVTIQFTSVTVSGYAAPLTMITGTVTYQGQAHQGSAQVASTGQATLVGTAEISTPLGAHDLLATVSGHFSPPLVAG